MDTSCVFHISELDPDLRADHDEAEPWIFQTDAEGQTSWRTEREAYNEQAKYRIARGFNVITGRRGEG